MGYTTEFSGQIGITPPLSPEQIAKFKQLADTRHEHVAAPSYYCQWEVSATAIEWDGGEKFYGSEEWMALIVSALAAAGHTCNGTIDADGEESGDLWRLVVTNNVVSVEEATVSYGNGKPVTPASKPVALSGYAPQLTQTLRLTAA